MGEGETKKGNGSGKQGRGGASDCRALALVLEYGQFKKMGSS
ncbi:MAG: hypothetical protein ACI83P_002314 [Janthinobacterium sp.]|jgi:hypothetical protein